MPREQDVGARAAGGGIYPVHKKVGLVPCSVGRMASRAAHAGGPCANMKARLALHAEERGHAPLSPGEARVTRAGDAGG